MKTLKALLSSKTPEQYIDTPDENPRILFVCTDINSQGYYRMILPYLELPKYGYHTKILGLKKHDFNTTYTLDNLGLSPNAIEWADYIVFKQLTKDYRYFFQAILKINPNVELVMDIWSVIHGLPKEHPEHSKMNTEARQNSFNNLSAMNLVTSSSEYIIDLYDYLLGKHYPDSKVCFAHLPNLFPPEGLEVIQTKQQDKQQTSIRIGVLTSRANYADVLLLKSVFTLFKSKYEDYVSFVVFGWDGKLPSGDMPLQDVLIEYHKEGSFLDHHQKLEDLSLDIALLPSTPLESNKYRSELPFLECAALRIAVIATRDSIYGDLILNKSAILVSNISQWESAITLLIENVKQRKVLTENALDLLQDSYAFSPDSITNYKALYV